MVLGSISTVETSQWGVTYHTQIPDLQNVNLFPNLDHFFNLTALSP